MALQAESCCTQIPALHCFAGKKRIEMRVLNGENEVFHNPSFHVAGKALGIEGICQFMHRLRGGAITLLDLLSPLPKRNVRKSDSSSWLTLSWLRAENEKERFSMIMRKNEFTSKRSCGK